MNAFAQDLGARPDKASGRAALAQVQPQRVCVKENVQETRLVHKVYPVYPPFFGKRLDGTVVLHVVIGKNGCVNGARSVSGPPNLKASAVNAVLQWRYKPTLVKGMPVEVETTVTVAFPPPGEVPFVSKEPQSGSR